MAKKNKDIDCTEWLIPDRVLAAQARYNLRRLKKQIAGFEHAGSLMNQKIDELIYLLDAAKASD